MRVEKRTVYVADDESVFQSEIECIRYEAKSAVMGALQGWGVYADEEDLETAAKEVLLAVVPVPRKTVAKILQGVGQIESMLQGLLDDPRYMQHSNDGLEVLHQLRSILKT